MELHNLKPAAGSTKKRKRIARGTGSGYGGTSTRGHKGAKSRSGYSRKRNFEGGQMPLQMRLPKRGFKNINRVEYTTFNLDDLSRIAKKFNLNAIDMAALTSNRIVKKTELVKILGNGALESKLDVSVHAFSASAKEAIEKVGGTVTVL